MRAGDLASNIAAPAADNIHQLFTRGHRARLMSDLVRRPPDGAADDVLDTHFVDPAALRDGGIGLLPIRDLDIEVGDRWGPDVIVDIDDLIQPGREWEAGTEGARRAAARPDVHVGRKRVARLMRLDELIGVSRRRKRRG